MTLPIVLWKWGRRFTMEHVYRMQSMLARQLKLPHEIVLVTDKPAECTDRNIRVLDLWDDLAGEPGKCMRRLKAFDHSMRELIGPRFAWIDLDCVLTDDVTPIFSRAEDFIISGVELRPQPYNGSLVMMDAGARAHVYSGYERQHFLAERRRLNYGGSDQAAIAIALGPNEATWTHEDGVFTYRDYVDGASRHRRKGFGMGHDFTPTDGPLPDGCRIMVMNGSYDPTHTRLHAKSPWIVEHWR